MLAENIFSRTTQEAEEAARRADIALVTLDSPERLHHSLFPFDRSAAQWQSAYREIVTRTMIPIERVNLAGHNFQIYARPRVRIDGEPDGWITAAGVDIRVKTALLRVWPLLRVQGKTAGSKYLAGPLQGKLTIAGLPPGMTVPARVNIAPDESYEIEADLSGVAWPDRQIAEMHLSFDRFFIPQAMGLSSDSRKLVIQLPSSNYLTNRDGIAPAELSVRELFLDPP